MTPVRKGYVDLPHGQVHFRYGGRGPVVVLLHDALRSSMQFVPDIEWLGERYTVIAIDLPGCGNSAPPSDPSSGIRGLADAVGHALAAQGIERCALYGLHHGAAVALQFAADHPERTALAILDGLDLQVGPAAALEPQPQSPTHDGAHLARLWTRVVDSHRFRPWYDTTAKARMRCEFPDEATLHECATDLMLAEWHGAAGSEFAPLPAALQTIAALAAPAALLVRDDDPASGQYDRLAGSLPARCSIEKVPAGLPPWRTRIVELLQRDALPDAAWAPPPHLATVPSAAGRDSYVELVHGQVHVRLRGKPGAVVPLLLLHDVPGGARAVGRVAGALATDRVTIAPDFPGLGDSHPLPYPSLGSYVSVLDELLEALELTQVDVYAEGLAGCFAVALAARRPELVRRIVLDAIPMVRARDRGRIARQYCPPLAPDRHGTHCLRIWHQLRDAECSWPWFDRSPAAVRMHDPDFRSDRLHGSLVDVMKQLPSYGDAARAALQASVREILHGVHQPVLLLDAPGDVRYSAVRRAARHLRAARVVTRPPSPGPLAATLREFLS